MLAGAPKAPTAAANAAQKKKRGGRKEMRVVPSLNYMHGNEGNVFLYVRFVPYEHPAE